MISDSLLRTKYIIDKKITSIFSSFQKLQQEIQEKEDQE